VRGIHGVWAFHHGQNIQFNWIKLPNAGALAISRGRIIAMQTRATLAQVTPTVGRRRAKLDQLTGCLRVVNAKAGRIRHNARRALLSTKVPWGSRRVNI